MTRRDNGYTTVAQVKKNQQSKNGATVNSGRRAPYFTIGGRGTKLDQGKKTGGHSFWNPGRSLPSLRYINKSK